MKSYKTPTLKIEAISSSDIITASVIHTYSFGDCYKEDIFDDLEIANM